MGMLAILSRDSHAISSSVASIVVNIPAFKLLKVWDAVSIGMSGSSGVAGNQLGLYAVTSVGSGGSPTSARLEPENRNDSIPGGWSAVYGYTIEPTVGALILPLYAQPYGGADPWNGGNSPILIPNESSSAIQVAFRGVGSVSGNHAIRARLELGV